MALVSFASLIFLIITMILYYAVPVKHRWCILLAASLLYYFLAAPAYTILYVFISTITIYAATAWIEQKRRYTKQVYVGTLLINIGILVALKYMNFLLGNVSLLLSLFGKGELVQPVEWVASLGVSFYTLQMVGYLTDVYWGISTRQQNLGKLALFNCYFPQMISGPISRYKELEGSLFSGNAFDKAGIKEGLLRILLGVFKKLVVAEQLVAPTEAIFADIHTYNGVFIVVGMGLYVVRIYADFSGCMDIVLGASACFGVKLAENFKTPFASVTIQEFWQRWHITLGAWLKDYIMYPILRSRGFGRLNKWLKKTFGKQAAKKVPTFLSMLVLWLAMGLWHGGGWNFIGEGVFFWLVIVLGQMIPLPKVKVCAWFQKVRTAVIFAVGILFFRSPSLGAAFETLANGLNPIKLVTSAGKVLQVLAELDMTVGTGRILWTGVSVLFGLCIMYVLSRWEQKEDAFSCYRFLAKKPLWIRYAVVYVLVISILLLGAYGPGYSASEFIYGGF